MFEVIPVDGGEEAVGFDLILKMKNIQYSNLDITIYKKEVGKI